MKSADGHDKFFKDVKNGKANDFLCKCLIFTCFEPQNHCRSQYGSDDRLYINQMCFDGPDTIASKKLDEFISNGYKPSPQEEDLIADWNALLARVTQKYSSGEYRYPYDPNLKHGYNPEYKYGLYQIDEEINYKIEGAPDRNGKVTLRPNDGDLDRMISSFKSKVKDYYIDQIVPTLFKYEFLK